MTFTCTKRFQEVPFAHRAPNHDGHCKLLHGHNWVFEVTFASNHRDQNGFVVDFGKMGRLKETIATLDHALVLNHSDPLLEEFKTFLQLLGLDNIVTVRDCSAEGLAQWFWNECEDWLEETGSQAYLVSVTLYEDQKNSATITR